MKFGSGVVRSCANFIFSVIGPYITGSLNVINLLLSKLENMAHSTKEDT
jgi:hypothetical protein